MGELDDTKQLIIELAVGNPGALSILMSKEMMWYNGYFGIMQMLRDQGIKGSKIWVQVKDDYKMDIRAWMRDKQDEYYRLQSEKSGNKKMVLTTYK